MKYKNGDEELYDMIKDPAQFTNLATKEEHQSAKTELLSQLKKRLKSALLP
jgi:hypothetical protein